MSALNLTPVRPTAQQADFFAAKTVPVYPAFAVSRGDALRTARNDARLTTVEGAKRLGITVEQLADAERGALSFDLDVAKKMLRGGK